MSGAVKQDKPEPREQAPAEPAVAAQDRASSPPAEKRPKEIGGPSGLEPTRYGDWERAGRCVDF